MAVNINKLRAGALEQPFNSLFIKLYLYLTAPSANKMLIVFEHNVKSTA